MNTDRCLRFCFVLALAILFTACASIPTDLRSSPADGRLLREVSKIADHAHCRFGISVVHLESGRRLEWHATETFEAASVIKIAILAEALSRWQEGSLNLSERWNLTDEAKAAGSGVLDAFDPGLMPTNLDLLRLMIIVSDNTATNHWIDLFGTDAVNRRMTSLGFPGIRLLGRLPNRDPKETEEERWKALRFGEVTPVEVADYYVRLAEGKLFGTEATNLARQIFSEQHLTSRIPRRLLDGPGRSWEGKSGTLGQSRLDSGILTTPKGRYAMAIFADQVADNADAEDAAISAIGDIAYAIISQWERS